MSVIPALSAFVGGFATFFTPCVLPLVPAYIVYISGIGLGEISSGKISARVRAAAHSLFFAAGFSSVFFAMGLTATAAGDFIFANKETIRKIGGALMVLAGFFVAGIIRPKFLMVDTRFSAATKPAGYAGSFVVGAAFAGGWSPCVGPALLMILSLAASRETLGQGAVLLGFFSAGLAVPFVAAGFFAGRLSGFIAKIKTRFRAAEILFGFFIAAAGAALFAGLL